jgi:hypothetical protein
MELSPFESEWEECLKIMEPDRPLPYSHEPATGPSLEPDKSTPHQPALFLSDPLQYHVGTYALNFVLVCFSLKIINNK